MSNRIKNLIYPFITLTIISLLIVYAQSCKQDFVNDPGSVEEFPDDINAIFNAPLNTTNTTCQTPSCHANESNTVGMNLVDWHAAMQGSNNGTMIIPYNGFWSHMVSVINSDTNVAPVTIVALPELHKLDSQKVATIKNWITDGAKSKNGNIAYTTISNTEKGLITNQASDLVAVIKTNDKLVTRLIPVGGRPNQLDAPHYITIDKQKKYFYVSLIQEGYIEKYDLNTYAQVGRMQAGQSPAHIEISGDGRTGYVTNFESSGNVTTTTKFNTENMTITGIFSEPRMKGPHGMALSEDGSQLYVASEIGEFLFKISTSEFYASDSTYIRSEIDPTVPGSGNGTGNFRPYQIILSPDNSIIYVTCRGSSEVRIYNATDLIQINNIFLGTGSFPLLMKLTNDGSYLFVCNRNNNTVSVINTATQTIQTTITGVGIQPHGVDFTTDGQFAIIACETQSGFDGHHPQVGSKKIGVSRIIQIQGSNFNLLTNRYLEMGSFPAGIEIIK
ncbi:MAG: YncE family protein [Ignavibacteria bacterium]